ncbi:MAG: MFS transporter [Elusimicrobiota bacterium]
MKDASGSGGTRSVCGADFMLFRAGQFVSGLGDACAEIAVLWWVAEKTGSAVQIAAVFAPVSLVRIFLLPLFGPLGDKYSRKWLAIISDIWRGVFSVLLCALAWTDSFSLPVLITLFILSSAGSALFSSVADSIIPQMVGPDSLQKAYRHTNSMTAAAAIIGGIVGGFVSAKYGIKIAFFCDALSYFAGAGATMFIRLRYSGQRACYHRFSFPVWRTELKAGVKLVAGIPLQLWICGLAAFLNFVVASMTVAFPLLAKESGATPVWLMGLFKSGVSAGIIAGSLVMGELARRFHGDQLVMAGIAVMGAGLLTLGSGAPPAAKCLLMFAIGAGLVIINIPLMTQNTLAVPDQYRSRVLSLVMFFNQMFVPAGVILAGSAISFAGLSATLVAGGGLILLSAPAVLLIPGFPEFLRLKHSDAEGYFAKTYPAAFEGGI